MKPSFPRPQQHQYTPLHNPRLDPGLLADRTRNRVDCISVLHLFSRRTRTTNVSLFPCSTPGPGDNDLRRITGDRLAVRQGGAARREAFRRTVLLPALQALVELPEWGSWKASLRGCYPFQQVRWHIAYQQQGRVEHGGA